MAIHRTAQGRTIDMAKLIAQNEKVRAVGNMKVNARGDMIDSKGNVIKTRNQTVNERYNQTVGAKNVPPRTGQSFQSIPTPAPIVEDKLPTEEDFNDTEDLEIEKIKQQDIEKEQPKKGKK